MNRVGIVFMFISLILFETALYISVKEKFTEISYELKSVNIELEELRKTQRLISQDADLALRLAVTSAGGEDDDQ